MSEVPAFIPSESGIPEIERPQPKRLNSRPTEHTVPETKAEKDFQNTKLFQRENAELQSKKHDEIALSTLENEIVNLDSQKNQTQTSISVKTQNRRQESVSVPNLSTTLLEEPGALASDIDTVIRQARGMGASERQNVLVKSRTEILARLEKQLQAALASPNSIEIGGPVETLLTRMRTVNRRFTNRLQSSTTEDDIHTMEYVLKGQQALFKKQLTSLQAMQKELMNNPQSPDLRQTFQQEVDGLRKYIVSRFSDDWNGTLYFVETIRSAALADLRALDEFTNAANRTLGNP